MALENRCIATEMNIPQRDEPDGNKLIFLHIPVKYWGLPEDLEGAFSFLSSKASNYVLGAYLPINGGF
ncbi:MAG: hypothetical protein A2030_00170 [Chloroflexi bacterium RBG_19FT_COMBO_50_10]|nr:MAG: hypothetical protein A2030_00170 [Chloroflexi bacterium RBG_19FT_COMBO_50_10]